MCSQFLKMMENYQGDLADIVRATTGVVDGVTTTTEQAAATAADWQFPRNVPINYPTEYFGDPFSYVRDPLITQNIDTSLASDHLFYNSNIIHHGGVGGDGGVNSGHHDKLVVIDDEMKKPSNNIFSRMLQISPNPNPNAKLPPPCDSAAPPQRGLNNPSSILVSNNGSLLSPSPSSLQISSPRNTGIKRRKSQAKKVVCIPAPAPANSRSTGEVVPSDLWAWRKYGQKPIKGSPYPRGYYRCSSSKGCSARKQVERSRTDPNMLVITYTSEHNHPWPTQRNALAGSTRSQASKNNNNNNNNNGTTKDSNSSPNSQTDKPTKETSSPVEENFGAVKEELDQELDHHQNHHLETEFDEGFLQTYKPSLADSSNQEQDSFFAELGEIGDDPLHLFGQGFSRDGHNDLDPFSFYDWATSTATTTTTTGAKASSAEESGRKS